MRIFLIGFMGSGKTKTGKALAKHLHLSFTDLDNYIEKKEGKSISEIFDKIDEKYFRKLEHQALKKIAEEDYIIISCGGGTPCFFNNLDIMNSKGITVYLKYPIGKLKNRLTTTMDKRPLLKDISSPEDLELFISKTLEEREEFYLKSKLIINNPKSLKEIIIKVNEYITQI